MLGLLPSQKFPLEQERAHDKNLQTMHLGGILPQKYLATQASDQSLQR